MGRSLDRLFLSCPGKGGKIPTGPSHGSSIYHLTASGSWDQRWGLSFKMWGSVRIPPHEGQHHTACTFRGACLSAHCRRHSAHDPRGWNLAILCNLEALGAEFLSISEHPVLLSSPPGQDQRLGGVGGAAGRFAAQSPGH